MITTYPRGLLVSVSFTPVRHRSPRGRPGHDDSAGNVEAARACGWNAVRYRSPGDLGALTG